MNFLGVVQVPLALLYFIEGAGERAKQTDHLLFRGPGIDHETQTHWVDGYIDFSEATSAFREMRLSPPELVQKNFQGVYPRLQSHIVGFTKSRYRIEAARQIDPSLVWTVRLFCTSLDTVHLNQIVKGRTEDFSHKGSYSDGHIYSRLREHANSGFDYGKWHEQLTSKKKRGVQLIDESLSVKVALDQLTRFPGIMEFLQLTMYERFFSLRLGDEMFAGLENIYKRWSEFMCGSLAMWESLDKKTVKILEGRAPSVCLLDRQVIHTAFEHGEIFSSVTDRLQRREIERIVLTTPDMIPGIESFQSNLSYLAIAADIIWSHLLPKNLRKVAKDNGWSLRSLLRSCWIESEPYVEVQEGLFQPVLGPPSFELAYNVLLLAVIRQFPHLCDKKPYVDARSSPPVTGAAGHFEMGFREKPYLTLDNNCVFLLHRRASLLGFRTWKIEQGAAVPAAHFEFKYPMEMLQMEGFDEARFFGRPDRRWGRPFTRTFHIMQMNAFLPTIANATGEGDVSVLVVLGNLVATFFERCQFDFNFSRPRVSINGHQSQDWTLSMVSEYTSPRQIPGSSLHAIKVYGNSCYDSGMDIDSQPAKTGGSQDCVAELEDVTMQDHSPDSEHGLMDLDNEDDDESSHCCSAMATKDSTTGYYSQVQSLN